MRGGAVTLGAQAGRFALQVGGTMVLARLLTPGDFGVVAMVTSVTGFIASFKDAGLTMATVQRERIDHQTVSTLLWINVALSVAMMAVTALLAPAIAAIFGEPRLVWITLALAGSFLFSGLTVQHQALLRRQMRFGALASVEIASRLAGLGVGIAAAALGAGCWSLVLMAIASDAAGAAAVWVACDWRPGRPRSQRGMGHFLAFGGNLSLAHVVNNASRNLDNVFVGAAWGATLLGAYAKAYQLLLMPFQQFAAPVTSVAVPALSRLQNDAAAFRRFFCGGILLITALGMPVVAYCFVAAEDVTHLLLGEQWTAAAPIFRALAPAAFIETFNVTIGWALIPFGRADRYFRCVAVSSAVIIVAFLIGLPFGPIGVAAGYSAARVVLRVPQSLYAFAGTPLTLRDLGAVLWRPASSSLFAAAALAALYAAPFWPWTPLARAAAGLPIFAGIYVLLMIALPGGRAGLAEIIRIRAALRPAAPAAPGFLNAP